jgi:hypothetical protein
VNTPQKASNAFLELFLGEAYGAAWAGYEPFIFDLTLGRKSG